MTQPFSLHTEGDQRRSVAIASSCLFDFVLLAGGIGTKLSPVTMDDTTKALAPLINIPLIMHAVRPWLDAGVHHMYVCAPGQILVLLEPILQQITAEHRGGACTPESSTMAELFTCVATDADPGTCGALRCFHALRPASAASRDVLVASVDVVMANIDVWSFIRNFYEGFYSASCVYYEPYTRFDKSVKSPDTIMIEAPTPNSTEGIKHCRLHCTACNEEQKLSAGALFRRLNMSFVSSYVDAHIALLRSWVFDFLKFNTDLKSIQADLIPLLAVQQHPHLSHGGIIMPHRKLGMDSPVPVHWVLDTSSKPRRVAIPLSALDSVQHNTAATHHQWVFDTSNKPRRGAIPLSALNSVQHINPEPWDVLRTCATIFSASPSARIMRVNDVDSYRMCTAEILHGLAKPKEATALSRVMMKSAAVEDGSRLSDAAQWSFVMSGVPAGCRVIRSVIDENVDIGENTTIEDSILLSGSRIEPGVCISNCLVPRGVTVAASMKDKALV